MQTQLTLIDRILLEWSILPREDSFDKLILSKQIKTKVKITDKEIHNFNIRSNDKWLFWDNTGKDKNEVKDYKIKVEFMELEEKIISENLRKLDENKKLTEEYIDLYRIFVSRPNET